MEAGVAPPDRIVGASVGALNGATLAAFPTLGGAQMLTQIWRSQLVKDVFRPRPVDLVLTRFRRSPSGRPASAVQRLIQRLEALTGCHTFEDLRLPLAVVTTDLEAGRGVVFTHGPLEPALLASTAIPGVYPAVEIDGRSYLDGGIVDNTPISVAVEREGAREVLAIGLMGGAELEHAPATFRQLLQRTLEVSLHQRTLSDFARLRERARICLVCPVLPPDTDQVVRAGQVEAMIEAARASMRALLDQTGSRLFKRSGIHYLPLALPANRVSGAPALG